MIQFGVSVIVGIAVAKEADKLLTTFHQVPSGSLLKETNMTMAKWIKGSALVLALGLVACAGPLTTRGVKAEEPAECAGLKALEGTWTSSESDSLDARWVFKGETVEVTVNGMEYKGKVKVDDKAKPHSTLEIDLTEGPDDSKGKTAKALYKLEGEKLVVCVSTPGHDRPKDFEPVPDEAYLFELKKKKSS